MKYKSTTVNCSIEKQAKLKKASWNIETSFIWRAATALGLMTSGYALANGEIYAWAWIALTSIGMLALTAMSEVK